MPGSVLANSIKNKPHLQVYDDMAAFAIDALDLSAILTLMIDTAPLVMLPFLAKQFDVLGIKGWRFAKTETAQRTLLKNAVQLRKGKGTPGAIETALMSCLGIQSVSIQEGVAPKYNGQFQYNGQITYGINGWAQFRVLVGIAGLPNEIKDDFIQTMVDLINEYKNVRSKLIDVVIMENFIEKIDVQDSGHIHFVTGGLLDFNF